MTPPSAPTPAPDPGAAPPAEVRERLLRYARYAALVHAQAEALETEDLERFAELAQARDMVQEDLEMNPEVLPAEEELDEESRELFRVVREEMRRAVIMDGELRSRLAELRAELRGELEAMEGRKDAVRRYIMDEGAGGGTSPERLNVRL